MTPLDALRDLVGSEIGLSDWVGIGPSRLALYERAIGPQPIDPVPPLLLLSLLPYLLAGVSLPVGEPRATINYGLDRVEAGVAVLADEKVRARTFLEGVEVIGDAVQLRRKAVVEKETGEIALVAVTLTRLIY